MKTRQGLTFEDVVRLHLQDDWGFGDDQLDAFDKNDWSSEIKYGGSYADFLKELILEPDYLDWIGKLCVFWDDNIDLVNYPIDTTYLYKIKEGKFVTEFGGVYLNCMLLTDFIEIYGEKK